LLYWYKRTNTDADAAATLDKRRRDSRKQHEIYSVYLLIWDKSTNTDAALHMQQLLTRDEEISEKQHEISVREHELVAVRAEASELVIALANARDELEEETRNGRSRFRSALVL